MDLERWFATAPALFNPEVAGGLEAVLQVHTTTLDFSCAVSKRTLTLTRGVHPSPSLTVRGEPSDLVRIFTGDHEVLNSFVPFVPTDHQLVQLAPHDPQLLMWFVLLFRANPDAVSLYRKLMVGNIEYWADYRDFWRDHLTKNGLSRAQSLLDVGCGTLRAGAPLIAYLDPGNYCGVDIREEIIVEAKAEVTALGLGAKHPELVHNPDIRTLELGRRFDVVLAASLLFNLEDPILFDVLAAAARHLQPSGRMLGQVIPREQHPDWKEIRWLGFPCVVRTLEFYKDAAAANGLRVANIEPWNSQAILTFQLA
jgi:SAM-dependent methyltransferase